MNKIIKIIIATIAILLIGGAIYAIKYYDPKAPKYSKEVNTSVSDWKTYTSTKFGFEIKYPTDWKIDENTGGLDTSISIYKPNSSTGDNDSFVNRIHIDIDSSCDSTGWTTSRSEIYDSFNILNVCLDSSKSLNAELMALNDEYKTIEDLIISTFKLTSPTNTSSTQSSESTGIQVISPKSGDKLVIGKTYDVKWSNYSGQEKLNIVLAGKKSSTVITSTLKAANIGTYTMTVPAVDTSDTYKIEVYPAGGRELVGRSGEFTITN